jgi:GTP-binding protein
VRTQISIIGRPNVGKSTLVNRLVGSRLAIVGEEAGITRDRNYIDFEWEGHPFTIVDAGGITFDQQDVFAEDILRQALLGLEQSAAVLFITDVNGITSEDEKIAELLRRQCAKPVYLAINKVDSHDREMLIYEFYKLGFDKLYPISALHGSHGLSEMLTDMVKDLNVGQSSSTIDENIIKVAVVGKPNVGKSSLFNKLVGEERSIVSDVSGTTRDAINTKLTRYGQEFELIDTAGLRRKSKVKEEVERFSNIRTTYSIAACDVAVLLIDASEEEIVTDQDQRIAALIEQKGKACVVLINKWDLVSAEIKDDQVKLSKYHEQLDHKLRFIDYAEKEFISAHTGKRTDKVWEMIKKANEEHKKKLTTSILNKVLADISVFQPPPVVKQKAIKVKYITQINVAPPEFLLFTNYPELIPESYKRFLEAQFRQYFGFKGTPIRLNFRGEEK